MIYRQGSNTGQGNCSLRALEAKLCQVEEYSEARAPAEAAVLNSMPVQLDEVGSGWRLRAACRHEILYLHAWCRCGEAAPRPAIAQVHAYM
jgi:hypothetical protein